MQDHEHPQPTQRSQYRYLFTAKHHEGFVATWVGPHPWRAGLCLGSEDGWLLLTDEGGVPLDNPIKGSPSGEAINGVSGLGDWIAVSTRHEVSVGSRFPPHRDRHGGVPLGAHGITVAPNNECLVAPMGLAGLMMLKPGALPGEPVGCLCPDKTSVYFYQVVALPGREGKDLLVSACRQGGIGVPGVDV